MNEATEPQTFNDHHLGKGPETTFWQDHEKGHSEDYEYEYYDYDDEDGEYYEPAENGNQDQWEYYDEMYVTPEEELGQQTQPVPGAEEPVVTYKTFRKPRTKPGQLSKPIPHGYFP